MFNGYNGNHTAVSQNAGTIMLVHHGNQEHNGRQPAERQPHDGSMGRPSPIQHTTGAIKEEATGLFNTPWLSIVIIFVIHI